MRRLISELCLLTDARGLTCEPARQCFFQATAKRFQIFKDEIVRALHLTETNLVRPEFRARDERHLRAIIARTENHVGPLVFAFQSRS